MSKHIRPHHVGISVGNLKESIAWYEKYLDFKLESEYDFPAIKAKIAFIQKGDFRIELFEHYETQSLAEHRKHPLTDMQHQGILHVCFQMENGLEELFDRFKKEGVEVVMGPMLSPPKDATMGFIRDNTGNLIEFIQPLNKGVENENKANGVAIS